MASVKEIATRANWLIASDQTLPATMLVFLGSAFVLAPAPIWSLTFYLGVLPAAILRAWRGPPLEWRNFYVIVIGLVIIWSALTLIWGENPGHERVPKFLLGALCTAVFVAALMTTLREYETSARNIGTALIVAGAANAALSIMLYLHDIPPGWRLMGWAETRHPILGSLVIGVCYLFALERALHERENRRLNTAAAALCLCFIFLSGSRGPIIAIAVATLVLTRGFSVRVGLNFASGILGIIAIAAVIAFVFEPALPGQILHRYMDRPSYRLDIWTYTMSRVAEKPLFGHGLAAYLGMEEGNFTFPHNLFLSTLFYSGIVGLALLLALLAACLVGVVRNWRRPAAPLLLALLTHAIIGGLTDLGQLTPGPAPLWIILWLPIGLICAALTQKPSAPADLSRDRKTETRDLLEPRAGRTRSTDSGCKSTRTSFSQRRLRSPIRSALRKSFASESHGLRDCYAARFKSSLQMRLAKTFLAQEN
jgi:O-antigen ligase